jgi:hypothetical protein
MSENKEECYNRECPYYNSHIGCTLNSPNCIDKIKKPLRNDGLTEQEGKVMDALVYAWNEFTELEKTHPSETDDFMNAIHICQNTLCMRILRRDYPKGYPTYSSR